MFSESKKKVLGLLLKEKRMALAPNKKSGCKKGVSIRVDTELTTKKKKINMGPSTKGSAETLMLVKGDTILFMI